MAIPVGGAAPLLRLPQGSDLSLKVGEVLRAVVVDAGEGRILLRMAGVTLPAESRLPLAAGQRLRLRVTGMEGGQVLLEPLPPRAAPPEPSGIARLLRDLGLPPTPSRQEAAGALLGAGFPPTAARVEAYLGLAARLGETERLPAIQAILARLAGRGILPTPPALQVLVSLALRMQNLPPSPGPLPSAGADLLPLLRLFWSQPPPAEAAAAATGQPATETPPPAAREPLPTEGGGSAPPQAGDSPVTSGYREAYPGGEPAQPTSPPPQPPALAGGKPDSRAAEAAPAEPGFPGAPAPAPALAGQALRILMGHLHPLGSQAALALHNGDGQALANLPFLLVSHILGQTADGGSIRLPLADDPTGVHLVWRRKGGGRHFLLTCHLPRLGEVAMEFWQAGDERLLVLLRAKEEGTRTLLRAATTPLQKRIQPHWPRVRVALASWQEEKPLDATGLDVRR